MERISIPVLENAPVSSHKLAGLHLLHTHLTDQGLSEEDLMDLLFLRLDAIAVLGVDEMGSPTFWQYAFLTPKESATPYHVSPILPWNQPHLNLAEKIQNIEAVLAREETTCAIDTTERAILVSVAALPYAQQEKNLAELASLAKTAGVYPACHMIQRYRKGSSASLLGRGKMAELEVLALKHNANTLIFDGELSPSQLHNLADLTLRRVLDRTQLILDIFATHAQTRAGKLQVELAQLHYLTPRLAQKNPALDRLMGGIGGRGPGETKLESDRRKCRERMKVLREELRKIEAQRSLTRSLRRRNQIPTVAIVGYTNAGKSTLLNSLSHSNIYTADQLFATLDPVSRRIKYPRAKEIVFTDTIGFIRNLPRELMEAFKATLEELVDCDLLLHLVDASDDDIFQHIQAVEEILSSLNLAHIPTLLVFNKWDRTKDQENLKNLYPQAICISATTRLGLETLEKAVCSFFIKTAPPKEPLQQIQQQ